MQVFIIGTPLETAIALDNRRLNKQIIECEQILDALNGKKAWSNHPCTLQYKKHQTWLDLYKRCLEAYFNNNMQEAEWTNYLAVMLTPYFHTEDYLNQMKKRLYTKKKEHYKQFSDLGTSEENWYFVDNEWRIYKNGKRIK